VEDRSVTVAMAAARALRTQRLSESEWASLEALVREGHANPGADSALVEVVRLHPDAGGHGAAILRGVLARTSPANVDLRQTIESLLGD